MMELDGLHKAYAGKTAIADVSLTVRQDEYLTLLGPSGSGKSTLLRLIAGLERPDSGRILLEGEDLTLRPTHLRGLGFVQQKYALFPHFTVADNVAFGLRNRAVNRISDEGEVGRRVSAMLNLVGLDGLEDRMVGQISGGQKQRVSLARTLITEPKICLLDEPLGALDANLRERMTVELRRIREQLGVTFLHVTGNETEALAMGDRMIVLDEGRAIQIGPPEDVFNAPATVQAARFVNAYNILPGDVREGLFHHSGVDLPMPETHESAGYYVLPFDAVSISKTRPKASAGHAALEARFIASEFMGSKVIYFFHRPDGGVFEVERHLSRGDPVEIAGGTTQFLRWSVDDVLLFGSSGHRLGTDVREDVQ